MTERENKHVFVFILVYTNTYYCLLKREPMLPFYSIVYEN